MHSFILALDGGEWIALHPGRFTSRERAPGTYSVGVWVGLRAGPDSVKEKNSQPPPGFELRSSDCLAHSQSLSVQSFQPSKVQKHTRQEPAVHIAHDVSSSSSFSLFIEVILCSAS